MDNVARGADLPTALTAPGSCCDGPNGGMRRDLPIPQGIGLAEDGIAQDAAE